MKPTESDDVSFGERAVYVAIVDISGDGDFMELVRSALSAAISALQPCDLFALVTVSEDIGIYDLRADLPSARQVEVEASGAGLALCEIIPLQEALVPVGQFAAQIQGAIESLLAQQEAEGVSTSAVEADDVPRQRKRRVGFGAAVSSVVEFLGTSDRGRAYAPRLLSFLAGLPNHGPGSLRPRFANGADGRRQREREPSSLKPATTHPPTVVFVSGPDDSHPSCCDSCCFGVGFTQSWASGVRREEFVPTFMSSLTSTPAWLRWRRCPL